jgi:hypothetical protein
VRDGCFHPLKVWRTTDAGDVLLDGHNRREICKRLGIAFQVQPIALASRDHTRLWIRENRLGRHNLPDDQRASPAFSDLRGVIGVGPQGSRAIDSLD